MIKIEEFYKNNCSSNSDINEHLPILFEYAKKCNHITEMGVRWVSSTWAFLLSNPKKMISYDIIKHVNVDTVLHITKEYDINYQFFESDVLKVNIEKTDLLFIDTLHTYNQLSMELNLHSNNVSKYIILHDTLSFGYKDEEIFHNMSEIVKEQPTKKMGLKNAINDFLNSEYGSEWIIHEEFTNNNGLTILMRKNI